MSWASFNQTVGYINDSLRCANDVLDKKKGGTIGSRLQNAGQNLIFNSMATTGAAQTQNCTGSYLGYAAKYSANGNGQQALTNVAQASVFAHQVMHPFGSGYYWGGGMMGPGMGMGMGFPVPYRTGSMHPAFDSQFFRH